MKLKFKTENSNRMGCQKKSQKPRVQKKTNGFPANEEGEVTLNSYVAKTKSSGTRNTLLLQTTNPAHYITQDDKKASYLHDIRLY